MRNPIYVLLISSLTVLGLPAPGATAADPGRIDLQDAVVVTRPGVLPVAEDTAATVLVEEIRKRTGLQLARRTDWPAKGPVIALTSVETNSWGRAMPLRSGPNQPERKTDGYRLWAENETTVWVLGADPRGALFGVGQLLRRLDWAPGRLSLPRPLDVATAPVYPIRGHQLGYRATANSYDAWGISQYEQYIRELTFFGANCVEGIPFQDTRPTAAAKATRREMNQAIGDICFRYGLDYWAWIAADFDLKDAARRAALLDQCDEFFRDTKTFSGFFFPGGDPGDNEPALVLAFLEDVWKRLQPVHPSARIWLSMQSFEQAQTDFTLRYIEERKPVWLAGLVHGPSSPPLAATRARLPEAYRLRLYPDLTHNKLSQFEVPWWDQAYALTLGREAINPRPAEFARIYNRFAPLSDGFLSYSDGVHDDVNKTVWSARAWDPVTPVRDILIDYARVYLQPDVAGQAADGILALENNWRGPLVDNGAVEGTLDLWRRLDQAAPRAADQWRWQMCVLRANYDAYVRRRLISETDLEREANQILAAAAATGSHQAMSNALAVLNRAVELPVAPDLRARIQVLCEKLFQSIGLQTSVDQYGASGGERGAILDYVDVPLNNRWWLEDEFERIRALDSETARCARLEALAAWENPGPGSFYDNVGHRGKAPHVVGGAIEFDEPDSEQEAQPTLWWWDNGKSRARLTWQITMWPRSMVYEGLDPKATYVVRSSGYGQALLRIDGERVQPTQDGSQMGELKEFPVPPGSLQDRRLVLTWDPPVGVAHLNWRQKPRLAEVWLIKR